ncbi:hypothetical protein KSD_09790 [Ktedonobacter sp. SOSP1-85]|uniref:hypothetical protein n=1 Tax=Ktedonobacter sp. SOSP1-85 TaxID=2778367 RepID=UPI0019165498|nr:hypothetical protein [Ktedonobacter sp. SOSP1-85]GHO73208.1 hypothetical protein KSD_09790 [Ktedonobacter sp. SOSP1-85]
MEKDQGYQEEEPQEPYNDGGTLGYGQSFDQQHLQMTQPLRLPCSAREERLRFLSERRLARQMGSPKLGRSGLVGRLLSACSGWRTVATHPAYAHPFAPGMVIMDQAYKYLVSSE